MFTYLGSLDDRSSRTEAPGQKLSPRQPLLARRRSSQEEAPAADVGSRDASARQSRGSHRLSLSLQPLWRRMSRQWSSVQVATVLQAHEEGECSPCGLEPTPSGCGSSEPEVVDLVVVEPVVVDPILKNLDAMDAYLMSLDDGMLLDDGEELFVTPRLRAVRPEGRGPAVQRPPARRDRAPPRQRSAPRSSRRSSQPTPLPRSKLSRAESAPPVRPPHGSAPLLKRKPSRGPADHACHAALMRLGEPSREKPPAPSSESKARTPAITDEFARTMSSFKTAQL
jgi:hypothetical protein